MRFKKSFVLAMAALLSASTLFYACRKTDSLTSTTTAEATCSVSGRILDEAGLPVSGATVRAAGSSVQTDVNGSFSISGVAVGSNGLAYVRVEKSGYYPGSRTLSTRAGAETSVRIQLIPRTFVASFSGSSGGTAPLDAGGSVTFPANGFVDAASNAPYTGTVKVAAFTFDPTAAAFNDIMPGALLATRTDQSPVILRSFSMVAVELQGSNGQKLQLAPGKEATIRFPIPAPITAAAPATIPLWYFDEEGGLWKEEGSAQKQGAYYEGKVRHFSFWNCDVPADFINFSAKVLVQRSSGGEGTPAVNARVVLTRLSENSSSASGNTDQNGIVSGSVPANVPLRMDVYNRCGNVVYSDTIGPFNTNTSTTISIPSFYAQTTTFSGSVMGCNGQPLAQGMVTFLVNGTYFRTPVVNGSYSYTLDNCSNAPLSVNLWAADPAGMQISAQYTATGDAGGTAVTNLSACWNTISQYVSWSLNGSTRTMTPVTDSVFIWCYNNPSESIIYAVPLFGAQQNAMTLHMTGPQSAGPQAMTNLEIIHNFVHYMPATPGSVQISAFEAPGGVVAGTFSATVQDSAGLNSYPVTGNFRLQRGF